MSEEEKWTALSMGLIVFAFINFILFITFSDPFNSITGMIVSEAGKLGVGGDVNHFVTMLRNIFGLMFVLSFIGLIVWFILGAHREEHEEYPRDYYK